MDIKFNMAFDEPAETKRIEERFRFQFRSTADDYIRTLLESGKSQRFPKGAAYAIIENYIDNTILSEKAEKMIKAFIEENWEPMLLEATKKALERKAHKMAFSQVEKKS